MAEFGMTVEVSFSAEEIQEGDASYKAEQIVAKIKEIEGVKDASLADGPVGLEEV